MAEGEMDSYEKFVLKFFGASGLFLLRTWRLMPEAYRGRIVAVLLGCVFLSSSVGVPIYIQRAKIRHYLGTDQIPVLVQQQNHMARGLARVPGIAQAFQAVDSEDLARHAYDSIAAEHQRSILGDNRQAPAQVGGNYIWALTVGVVP